MIKNQVESGLSACCCSKIMMEKKIGQEKYQLSKLKIDIY